MVINVSSLVAYMNLRPDLAAYGTANALLVQLWDSLVGSNPNICVFRIQPDVIVKDMSKEARGIEMGSLEDDIKCHSLCQIALKIL